MDDRPPMADTERALNVINCVGMSIADRVRSERQRHRKAHVRVTGLDVYQNGVAGVMICVSPSYLPL